MLLRPTSTSTLTSANTTFLTSLSCRDTPAVIALSRPIVVVVKTRQELGADSFLVLRENRLSQVNPLSLPFYDPHHPPRGREGKGGRSRDEREALRREKKERRREEKRARRERKLSKKQKNVSSSTEESPAKVGRIFSPACQLDLSKTKNYIFENSSL